jgi:hypothetical protein
MMMMMMMMVMMRRVMMMVMIMMMLVVQANASSSSSGGGMLSRLAWAVGRALLGLGPYRGAAEDAEDEEDSGDSSVGAGAHDDGLETGGDGGSTVVIGLMIVWRRRAEPFADDALVVVII